MRPTDLAKLRIPGHPTVSPDGRLVAYSLSRIDLEADAYRSDLMLVATDGSAPPRRLTHGQRDAAPRFSPDGRWLAFLRAVPSEGAASGQGGDDGKPQLHVMPVDGGEARQVCVHPLGVGEHAWHPDSRRVAYVARVPEESRYGTDADVPPAKEPARRITTRKRRLDGVGWTVDRRPHVFVVEALADEPEPLQVTDGDFDHAGPAWSPDGAWLAFVSARHEQRDLDLAADVFVVATAALGAEGEQELHRFFVSAFDSEVERAPAVDALGVDRYAQLDQTSDLVFAAEQRGDWLDAADAWSRLAILSSLDSRIALRHAASATAYVVDVRVFDDGVGFRYVVPGVGSRVPDEATAFVLPAGSTVWYHDLRGHYEGHHGVRFSDEALRVWAVKSDGDARRALNALEVAVESVRKRRDGEGGEGKGEKEKGKRGVGHRLEAGPTVIDRAVAEESIQQKAAVYDGTGDEHYDAISAMIKSVRGSDPDAAVPGIFGPSNLPQLERSDYTSNANNSYWLTNPAQPLEGFSPIIGAERSNIGLRPRLALHMVEERLAGADGLEGTGFTLERLQQTMFGNRNYGAELVRDDLVALCLANPTVTIGDVEVELSEACDVLADWDLRVDRDSRGAHLFREFAEAGGLRFAVPFSATDPLNTPNTLDTPNPAVLQALGRAVQRLTGSRVNLEHPAATVYVEILPGEAICSVDRMAGPGGLPVGTGGTVTALLSGGIDSPLAAHRMQRRGCRVHFVHFSGQPFHDARSAEKAEELAAVLATYQGPSRLTVVPFGEIQLSKVTSDAFALVPVVNAVFKPAPILPESAGEGIGKPRSSRKRINSASLISLGTYACRRRRSTERT